MERYSPTGNEMISLPTVNELTGGIEAVGFLSMAAKGLIELRGSIERPFLLPFFEIDGQRVELNNLSCEREHYWIPKMRAELSCGSAEITVLTPVGERGFALRLELECESNCRAAMGLDGNWLETTHCVNEEKPVEGTKHCYESGWNGGIILDQRCGYPLFAIAPMCDREMSCEYECGESMSFRLRHEAELEAGIPYTVTFFWGLGFEEVAAATSAKEMLRRTWEWEYAKTVRWLDERSENLGSEKLNKIYNTNLFFCMFYSTGITMDTEELICATSRSPRYYVSAAYWDRDTLLWSFPAILKADRELAREMLVYVFTRQSRNIGVHSRYIDGTVLEPGFELDELMAPIIALNNYVRETEDRGILSERFINDTIERILKTLRSMRHSDVALYETFLQPTDDELVYPYLTYDNVLVWKALIALAGLYPEKYSALAETAEETRLAIYNNCVFADKDGKSYFGWSVDLNGNHDVYDEPPGSLQLLNHLGFCAEDDEVWKNTVTMIRSKDYEFSFADSPIAEIGCPHAPWPWVLSLCNSLLCGYKEQALNELKLTEMDNGIACESVDPVSGVCTTGAAFATCAGFLCYAIRTAVGGRHEN
ncbi:MAG: glycoside hydrolase family 125 protein [Bacillota bacterium]|nr:glycoside hydrolase family 125 protein [Bacillota bacterium]